SLSRLVTLNYANKIKIVEGDREVWPGIRVHKVGGHTAGLQIVTVETRRGPVVLTSDASPFYHNVDTRQPPPFTKRGEPGSRSKSPRACPRCSPPSRRSTGSPARPSSSSPVTILK